MLRSAVSPISSHEAVLHHTPEERSRAEAHAIFIAEIESLMSPALQSAFELFVEAVVCAGASVCAPGRRAVLLLQVNRLDVAFASVRCGREAAVEQTSGDIDGAIATRCAVETRRISEGRERD